MKLSALWLALCVGAVACGDSNSSGTCSTACQKVLTCSGGAGYGYGFGFSGTANPGSFGYGVYGYAPDLSLSECTSGCQALPAADQSRIISCVSSAATCSAALPCD